MILFNDFYTMIPIQRFLYSDSYTTMSIQRFLYNDLFWRDTTIFEAATNDHPVL